MVFLIIFFRTCSRNGDIGKCLATPLCGLVEGGRGAEVQYIGHIQVIEVQ